MPDPNEENNEHLNPAKEYVDSEKDERTKNNVVRHEYRVLSDEEKQHMLNIKDIGLRFIEMVDALKPSREMSLAKTKIEKAVMWAVKGITQ